MCASGRVCGCFSARQGTFATSLAALAAAGGMTGIVCSLYFNNYLYYVPSVRDYLITDLCWAGLGSALVLSVVTGALALSKSVTFKFIFFGLAVLLVVSAIMNIAFSGMLSTNLRQGSFKIIFMDKFVTRNMLSGSMLGQAAAVAGTIWTMEVMTVLSNVAPYPINLIAYLSLYPGYAVLAFCGVALPLCFAAGAAAGLGMILAEGGDGTELLPANKIKWFYSLSVKEQELVRAGEYSSGEDTDEEEDDEDSDRSSESRSEASSDARAPLKAALVKKATKKAHKGKKGKKHKDVESQDHTGYSPETSPQQQASPGVTYPSNLREPQYASGQKPYPAVNQLF